MPEQYNTDSADRRAMIIAEYDRAASDYESKPTHRITGAEDTAWQQDFAAAQVLLRPGTVLDVGTGTGVFARWWASRGARVTGIDPSPGMIETARRSQGGGSNLATPPEFLQGHAENPTAYPPGQFDMICCRQAACYFADPIAVFQQWRLRLVPRGQVLVIEGLWPRLGFGDPALIDHLPLSCVQTPATLAYMLGKAGFGQVSIHWLDQVNAFHDTAMGGDGARYAVIASDK